MKKNEVLENYDMEDLSFLDYPNPIIMQIAIWVQRREFKKMYPDCEVENVHFRGFVRVIAHKPKKKLYIF